MCGILVDDAAVELIDGPWLSSMLVYRDGDDSCYIMLMGCVIYVAKINAVWREIGVAEVVGLAPHTREIASVRGCRQGDAASRL